ncbi:hypothetical protein JCM33374_g5185 [Metschnikowia sp. JCM 33374]|nr:hypothetical protein JCM33374_g5185 [Metschnikowia sp. JCM 33374]
MSTQTQSILKKAAKELYPLITKEFSDQSTKRFNNELWTLSELDAWKNSKLPQTLEKRESGKDGLHLTKDELVLLMDWKLAKGKFRPTLPKLIKSNSAESVAEFSRDGYAVFMDYLKSVDAKDWSEISLENYKSAVRASLKALCQLKGVGPATASLMLSLLSGVTKFAPPFFSDESYMYYIRDVLRPSQPIKYSVKEYVEELIPVLVNLSAEDKESYPDILEKGAWSLKTYSIFKIDRLADLKLPLRSKMFP